MSEVQLREIEHSFGPEMVLKGLNLSIDAGDYVVLLGQSGCGKTTTLRVIAGLCQPKKGDVFLGGANVRGVPPRRRDVSMVFQNDTLYPHLTVRQSIGFTLKRQLSRSELATRVAEAAELAGAARLLDRYPDRLSGGELRRAAIAKSIARQASIRLMDEPMSALDTALRQGLQDDLLRWHEAVPGTTIHVTHDGQEAMRLADKIAVMQEGVIVQFGAPQTIYDQPATRSVAQAVGSPPMALIRPDASPESIRLVGTLASAVTAGVQIGVRPESWRLAAVVERSKAGERDNATDSGLWVEGVVRRVTEVDGRWQVGLAVGGTTIIAALPAPPPVAIGEGLQFFAAPDDLHRFDAASGRRLSEAPRSP